MLANPSLRCISGLTEPSFRRILLGGPEDSATRPLQTAREWVPTANAALAELHEAAFAGLPPELEAEAREQYQVELASLREQHGEHALGRP
jgi:hypothetical protein